MAETPNWNLSVAQWEAVVSRALAGPDALADGAFVRGESSPQTQQTELLFFATALNKPLRWGYPFLEAIPLSHTRAALIGRVWQEAGPGPVQFEVMLPAAAQAIAADYESGASDLDFVTYEQAVEAAVRGTAADLAWLHGEFGHLAVLSVGT